MAILSSTRCEAACFLLFEDKDYKEGAEAIVDILVRNIEEVLDTKRDLGSSGLVESE